MHRERCFARRNFFGNNVLFSEPLIAPSVPDPTSVIAPLRLVLEEKGSRFPGIG
jgi:hypothetical protein